VVESSILRVNRQGRCTHSISGMGKGKKKVAISGKKNLRPEHLDARDALDVSDATCLTWTTLVIALCIATYCATTLCIQMQQPRHMRLDE